MDYTDDENIGLKVLLGELDAEPMRMVSQSMPEYLEVSVGRLFITWSRKVDRDIAAGLGAPLPCRDLGRFEDWMQRWVLKTDVFLRQYQYELVEIIDWLLLAGAARHSWLENVDERNRPRKLMKCHSVQMLYNESVKCLRGRQPRRRSSIDLTEADERHLADIGAGYAVVELLTADALDVESARMRHCIGQGNYDAKLGTPGFRFFSIRDSSGQPRATVEATPKLVSGQFVSVIRQLRGPRNMLPEPHVVELFTAALDDILTDVTPMAAQARRPSFG
ncbi:hypothetical protein ACQQ2Q_04790 [Agrobacterium sp. ES01]|uniref:hypothetical protein n=1 Tax=Agrobacterium sp. ES01 TaxID=3420714 RepID=UPI003D1074B9